jgi:hypothetical protein
MVLAMAQDLLLLPEDRTSFAAGYPVEFISFWMPKAKLPLTTDAN